MDPKAAMSQEDQRALRNMQDSVKLKNGHYEIALPWRNPPPICLPDYKPLAELRLKLLKGRLEKGQGLFQKYSAFVSDLMEKGYAQKVPKDRVNRSDGATWYLPQHPVIHPQKPGKVRVVFDCAAKYRSTSLNDQLLQGPDITNTLIGVLTCFREESIALMADIEAMFHQVRVRPDDCDALRFLWWPGKRPLVSTRRVSDVGSLIWKYIIAKLLEFRAATNSRWQPTIIRHRNHQNRKKELLRWRLP